MAKIVVFLTSFNRPSLLRRSIDSILNQCFKDFTLFVLDDNSIPSVQETIRKYEKQDSRIRVFISNVQQADRIKQCRYSVMINAGIRMTTEPYICYCTDDCFYMPKRLQRAVAYLDKNPEVMAVYNKQKVINEKGQTIIERKADKIRNKISFMVDHNSVTHRREILAKTGYWNTNPSVWATGDGDLWDRMSRYCNFYPIDYTGEINLLHKKSIGRIYIHGGTEFTEGIRE